MMVDVVEAIIRALPLRESEFKPTNVAQVELTTSPDVLASPEQYQEASEGAGK
jgi:hypothetical protein